MKKVFFVTTNRHKWREVKKILREFDLIVEQIDMEYNEDHDSSMEQIATRAAKELAVDLKKPIAVEDTGLFFEAYPGFPGALPKFVFNTLGYEGIFKLLAGQSRKAYFSTVAAYCEPGGKPKSFTGIMKGIITEKVFNKQIDAMPYDRIFIPQGESVTISDMTMEKKNGFSQRGKAFRKLGQWLTKQ